VSARALKGKGGLKLLYTMAYTGPPGAQLLGYKLSVCLCLHFNSHFRGGPGLASTKMSLISVLDDGGGGDNWSCKP